MRNPRLYWNDWGAIACGIHAPGRGTDTWIQERWKVLSAREAGAVRESGLEPACEVARIKPENAARCGERV